MRAHRLASEKARRRISIVNGKEIPDPPVSRPPIPKVSFTDPKSDTKIQAETPQKPIEICPESDNQVEMVRAYKTNRLYLMLKARKEKKEEKHAEGDDKSAPAILDAPTVPSAPPSSSFWSERHPKAWDALERYMPRLPVLSLLIVLLWSMQAEYLKGNYDFFIDWWNASFVGPALVELMTVQGAWDQWVNHYAMLFTVIMLFIVGIVIVVYWVFWRIAFKDYIKFSEGARTKEARCYWRTNNWAHRWLDRKLRNPPRTKNVYWLKLGWWPPFILYLINPTNAVIKLETSVGERCEEKSIHAIMVHERKNWRKIGNDPKRFETTDDIYVSGDIPNVYAQEYFNDRTTNLISDTTDLSFGNADTRNQVMRDGVRLSKPTIRKAILDDRKRREQQQNPG